MSEKSGQGAGAELSGPPSYVVPSPYANTLVPPAGQCGFCGSSQMDESGTVCRACGAKVGRVASIVPEPVALQVGDAVAGGAVLSVRGADEARVARGEDTVVLLLGSFDTLDMVRRAHSAADADGLPSVIETGVDAAVGPYLLLQAPPSTSRPVAMLASGLPAAATLSIAEQVLEIADVLGKRGYAWYPEPSDFWLDEGRLCVSRARVVPSTGDVDVGCAFASLGALLMPGTVMDVSPALVRLLISRSTARPTVLPTVRDLVAEARRDFEVMRGLPVGGVTDVGLKRAANEDAYAVASGTIGTQTWASLVVCDGVSSSSRGGEAARVATLAASELLVRMATVENPIVESPERCLVSAIRAGHRAACQVRPESAEKDPPGTTIVAAFVVGNRLSVAWVGDSRAYLVTSAGAEQLTRDHSWLNELVARGDMSELEASFDPMAHALTRCLGPLEEGVTDILPDVVTRELSEPCTIVLCSDGFWNYFPRPGDIATVLRSLPSVVDLDHTARALASRALARGGHDNTTLALYRHPPVAP